MEKLGLKFKVVKGDGNCLFRSFSDQVEGSENNHAFYRQSSIEYMTANEEHFKNFMEDDEKFEDYINKMKKDGEWGGNLEIYV